MQFTKLTNKTNNNMYQTNQQAWDEVTRSFTEANRRTEICQQLFNQDNLIGLTNDQRDLFWESI